MSQILKHRKRGWAGLILLILLIHTLSPSYAQQSRPSTEVSVTMQINHPQAVVNQKSILLDQPPVILAGRTMVPLRFISETLGARVEWESNHRQITLLYPNLEVLLHLNQHAALVNQQKISLDVAPIVLNGRTLVPLRFISETLGFKVDWIEETNSVSISGTILHESGRTAIASNQTDADNPPDSVILHQRFFSDLSTTQDNQLEYEVIRLVNLEREKHNLSPLSTCDYLMTVAQAKSADMYDNNYIAHTSPVYGSLTDLLNYFHIDYRLAGENIAAGQQSPSEVVEAWMDSPGHRQNILNPDYHRIGVGAVEGGPYNGITWTQTFTD